MATIEDELPDLARLGPSMNRQQPPLTSPMGRVEIQALTVTDTWATTRR